MWQRWKASSFGRSVHLAVKVRTCDASSPQNIHQAYCTVTDHPVFDVTRRTDLGMTLQSLHVITLTRNL